MSGRTRKSCRVAGAMGLCLLLSHGALGLDRVTIERDGTQRELVGRVVVTAQDGGLLFQTRDGQLWTVPPDEQIAQAADETPFAAFTSDELQAELTTELGSAADFHATRHYLIRYNTSRAYAQWCGALFERLYDGFTNFWRQRGFELREPEFPLVAFVYSDYESYAAYAERELGEATPAIIGYYNLQSNRMAMYDLTGIDALRQPDDRRGSAAQINRMLSRPEAERTVATVVHEATHQIAFNCGLSTRLADIPLWVSEGIAMYFETPDLKSSRGWRSIGDVNSVRLGHFLEYAPRRGRDSLTSLLVDDRRLRQTDGSNDGYGEAWALTYFLLRQRSDEFVEYLQTLSQKKPLVWDEPSERLQDFRAAFGDNLPGLDEQFVRQIQKLAK